MADPVCAACLFAALNNGNAGVLLDDVVATLPASVCRVRGTDLCGEHAARAMAQSAGLTDLQVRS